MPAGLERVPVPPATGDLPVPHYIDSFIRDAEDYAEELGETAGRGLFVPGDYRLAYQTLQWLLRTRAVAPGAAFLEWGSGLGMVAILAALLGYRAQGVERDAALVKAARELAFRYEARARFVHGSYEAGVPGLHVVGAARQAVVYGYPWPGEEGNFLQRFAATADPGAYFLMCLGPEDIRVYRQPES